MNWRPDKDWDERIVQENMPCFKWGTVEYGVFIRGVKIGADAMLEALRKERGVRINEATRMVTQPIFESANGYLVFIPDEKEVKE